MESDPTAAEEEDPGASWLGRLVAGRFRLTEVLGTGGIAVVFRAEDTELSRIVAVKVLQEKGHGHSELRARFEREARALAALSHPNIVSLVDYGVEDERAYLVMELLKGQTLGELLDQHSTLPPERAFHILRQVVRALEYAHGEGLLHRDLKPDNVFLQALPDTPDHVRLLDFGFAKFVSDERRDGPAVTQAGTVFGTPRYMAPEQLTGSSVDGRVDLYAVAVILFETLAGRRPFEGEVRDVLRAKVVEDPPTLASVAPDLDIVPELEVFFRSALAIEKKDRHADARAFLEALDAIPQPAVKAKGMAPPPKKRSGRMLTIAIAGGLLGALGIGAALCGVGVWLFWPEDPPPVTTPAPVPIPEPVAPPENSLLPVPDPWASVAAMPPALADARGMIDRGEPVSLDAFRALREYAVATPNDPYAQLLLGHVYTERHMRAMAVQSYERAAQLDNGARGDPRMIVNLVQMASDSSGSGPARVIREVYGAEAIPVLESAIDRESLQPREARRLTELRDELAGS